MIEILKNIFQLPVELPQYESFEPLASSSQVLVERIISTGQTTPAGEWYDQERDEWVILLQGQARLSFGSGSQIHLQTGDYLLIPAHHRHRVEYTSTEPPCIWLAIHANFKGNESPSNAITE